FGAAPASSSPNCIRRRRHRGRLPSRATSQFPVASLCYCPRMGSLVPGSVSIASARLEAVDRWATFDCYGTLIDWNGGLRRELARVFGEERADELLARYHELEPQVQAEQPALPYRRVMAEAMRRLGAPPREEDALGESLPRWDPFP